MVIVFRTLLLQISLSKSHTVSLFDLEDFGLLLIQCSIHRRLGWHLSWIVLLLSAGWQIATSVFVISLKILGIVHDVIISVHHALDV